MILALALTSTFTFFLHLVLDRGFNLDHNFDLSLDLDRCLMLDSTFDVNIILNLGLNLDLNLTHSLGPLVALFV